MTKSGICVLLTVGLGWGCVMTPTAGPVDHRRSALLAQRHPVGRATSTITVDGRLDEADWKAATPVPMMIPGTLAEPITQIDVRMVWDRDALYVGYRVMDHDLVATLTERDAETWNEDVVEAFFNTTTNDAPYYELEFSPRGTIYDSIIGRRGAAGLVTRWSSWNADGLQVATTYDGTLNQWRDRDSGYTVEVRIPFAALETLNGRAPRVGDTWRFCLAAYNYSVHLEAGRELVASAPLPAASFHQYEYWRFMRFE